MTLCVAFVSPNFAGCVSDRRLTAPGQVAPLTEEANKSGVVEYTDGLLTYSFSGLAKIRRHDFIMSKFLAEAVCDAGAGGVGTLEALNRLAHLLTEKFNSLRVELKYKATTIVLSGYVGNGSTGQAGLIAVLSNFEAMDGPNDQGVQTSFGLYIDEIDLSAAAIRQTGLGQLSAEEAKAVADLLIKPIHPDNAIRRLVQAVRDAAMREKSGSVGNRCSSIYVVRGFRESALVDYHSDGVSSEMYYPDYVNAKYDHEGAYIISGGRASGYDQTGTPLTSRVAKVGRNRPCPCGSNEKYKRCHGAPDLSDFGPNGAHSANLTVGFMLKQQPTRDVPILSLYSKLPDRTAIARGATPAHG